METYSALRAFADSWVLLALALFFLAVVLWVFRPGARAAHQDAANVIFRNDRRPGDSGPAPSIKKEA
jgi:cytochrome c oxidase cbb3-type subunit IV